MKKIIKVSGYQLSDGRVIENKEEAEKLQAEINFKEALKEFTERYVSDETYNGIEDFQNIVIQHANKIEEILKLRLI